MKTLSSLLLFILLFSGCSQKLQPENKTLKLSVNQSQTIESAIFTVTQINDNRCPKNTNCFVAGKAEVFLNINYGREIKKVTLCIGADCKQETGTNQIQFENRNYNIALISVDPPNSTTPTQKTKTATLKINKS